MWAALKISNYLIPALLLLGIVQMHLRLRSKASAVMVASLALAIGWTFLAPAFDRYFPTNGAATDASALILIGRNQLIIESVTATLYLIFSISFLLSAFAIGRPNNSFKPKPLRGSA